MFGRGAVDVVVGGGGGDGGGGGGVCMCVRVCVCVCVCVYRCLEKTERVCARTRWYHKQRFGTH